MRLGVLLFARFDAQGEAVLAPRERARRVGRESTGRIVSLVEIQKHSAGSVRRVCVEVTARAVGLLPAGLVLEDDEQFLRALFGDGVKAVGLSRRIEDDATRRRLFLDHPEPGDA